MNKNYCIIAIAFMVLNTSYIIMHAEIGCMEKSLHLREKYDPKVLHEITCNCPCTKYIAQARHALPYGQCPLCKHYRIPRTEIIVTKAMRQAALQSLQHPASPIAYENAETALATLVAQAQR